MRAIPPRSMVTPGPLASQIQQYPSLNAPAVTNDSTRHMRAMATRANKSAGRDSVLRDYLATV